MGTGKCGGLISVVVCVIVIMAIAIYLIQWDLVQGSRRKGVQDNGDGSLDRLVLEVTTDVTQIWDVTGLGGG